MICEGYGGCGLFDLRDNLSTCTEISELHVTHPQTLLLKGMLLSHLGAQDKVAYNMPDI